MQDPPLSLSLIITDLSFGFPLFFCEVIDNFSICFSLVQW